MCNQAIFLLRSLLCLLAALHLIAITPSGQVPSSGSVDGAINQLWSRNELVRQKGKSELHDEGKKALPALLDALEQFVLQPLSTYADRQQRQRTQFVRANIGFSENSRLERGHENEQEVLKIALRVKRDLIALIRDLRPMEAVPLLIKLMIEEPEFVGLGREISHPEMDTLIEVGPAAIPELINTIQTASLTSQSLEYFGSAAKRRFAMADAMRYRIQKMGVIILGRIRDVRALPFLEQLAQTMTDEFLLPYIQNAIAQIKQAN